MTWIILSVSGILKEFSIKSPLFEMASKLEGKIEASNKEICGKINNVNQNIQSINSRIDNVITNISNSNSSSDARIVQILGENRGMLKATFEESGITSQRIEPEKKISQEHIEKIDDLMNKVKTLEDSIGKPQYVDVELIMRNANYYFYKSKFKKAIDLYNTVIDIEPDNVDALSNKGYALSAIGNYEESIEQYKKLLSLSPNHKEGLNNMAQNYTQLEKYDEALNWYNKTLELYPKYELALLGISYVLRDTNQYDEALKIIENFLSSNPRSAAVVAVKGSILLKKNNFEEGKKLLFEAVNMAPNVSRVVNVVANAFLEAETNLDEIKPFLEGYIRNDPKSAVTYYNLACLYALKENLDESLRLLEKAITLEPQWNKKAKKDKDFRKLRSNPKFQKLIES